MPQRNPKLKMDKPSFHSRASIDSLLEGYLKEPLASERYYAECSESQEETTRNLLSIVSSNVELGPKASCSLEIIFGEAVQNISQHCCGESEVRLYLSSDKQRLLCAFELSEPAQFEKEGHGPYLDMLYDSFLRSFSPDYQKNLSDYLNDELVDVDVDLNLGTLLIMRTKGLSKVGVADIGGKAYFFFEYSLGQ